MQLPLSVDELQQTVAFWSIRIALVVVVAGIVWLALVELFRRLWFRTRAARALSTRRKQVEEKLGMKISRVSRDGMVPIAPGDTSRWTREGLSAELGNLLKTPVKVLVKRGKVQVADLVDLPSTVRGVPRYEEGRVILGLSEDGETGVDLREQSGAVVGAMPGYGKSILLQHLVRALSSAGATVKTFDGKREKAEDFLPVLKSMQKVMNKRLSSELDFWRDPQGEKLLVAVVDECQLVFSAASSSKDDKKSADDRTRLVRDLVQRGRSAGVFVVLATQRMTADVLPTAIRDLCGVKICGHVTRPEDAELVLGRRPEDGEPSPLEVGRGRFVCAGEDGNLVEIQVFAP